jgi:ribonuclease HI
MPKYSIVVEIDAPDQVTAKAAQEDLSSAFSNPNSPLLPPAVTVDTIKGPVSHGVTRRPGAVIYTDGACIKNPGGPGGWGYVCDVNGLPRREMCGGEPSTTNNRMELMAVIAALESLEGSHSVTLFTDSKYVQKGISGWINGWKRNGWKTATGQPVKNRDLWVRLDDAASRHLVKFKWVKGHAGNAGNELADHLANKGMKPFLQGAPA